MILHDPIHREPPAKNAKPQAKEKKMTTPDILLGPPGTGKTTSLLAEVEKELASKTHPGRIGYISFTRKAADEAITRACERFKKERLDFPNFRTIHSLCFKYLGLSSSDVLEGKRLREFADYARIKMTGRWTEDGTLAGFEQGDRILFMEHLSRVRRVTLREQYQVDNDGLPWNEVLRVAKALQEYKMDNGLMDYTDMLLEFVRLGNKPKLDVLFVDEAQDLSAAQWDVVRLLAKGCRRIVIAGDDDQAIYRWAGADVEFFIALKGNSHVLNQSWRVPRRIQELADGIIGGVRSRREKEWKPRPVAGELFRLAGFDKVDVSSGTTLILARNEYVLREQIEPLLRRTGIVYERRGHPSVKPSILEAILAWEKLRRGDEITGEQARKVYHQMTAGQGVKRGFKSLPKLGDEDTINMGALLDSFGLMVEGPWFESLDRIPVGEQSYIRAALRHGEKLTERPRVRISTIHGSKGGEADHVVVLTEMAKRTHSEMMKSPDDERRVWYVAATRAKERLSIVSSRTNLLCPWM